MNHKQLEPVEQKIEGDLKKHDYKGVYEELDQLRQHDPKDFKADLKQINEDLHKGGYLPGLSIELTKDGKYFELQADQSQPPASAPSNYNPPPGGYDSSGSNVGGGSGGYGGGGGYFGGDVGGDGGFNTPSGSSEGASLPASGPQAFQNYDDSTDPNTDQSAIDQAAEADQGQAMWSGWAGTDNGVEGCAASVSSVLDSVGAAHLSSANGDALCSTMQQHLQQQGWTVTNTPQPGDVVIGYGGLSSAHTGIVLTGNKVADNHSSNGKWSTDNLSYFSNWNKVVFLKPPAKKA